MLSINGGKGPLLAGLVVLPHLSEPATSSTENYSGKAAGTLSCSGISSGVPTTVQGSAAKYLSSSSPQYRPAIPSQGLQSIPNNSL